jgi:1,2-dihydroxy-3-keto-5-methylthiopentene dioxygenase
MRAYYFDNLPGDQRLPHDSSRPVDAQTLKNIKVEFWNIPVEGHEERLNVIAREREYKNRDVITVSKEGLGDVSLHGDLT